jgi:hypothetical protein
MSKWRSHRQIYFVRTSPIQPYEMKRVHVRTREFIVTKINKNNIHMIFYCEINFIKEYVSQVLFVVRTRKGFMLFENNM